MNTKCVVQGLHYLAETILEWLGFGMTIADILEDYEDIEQEDIYAELNFAA